MNNFDRLVEYLAGENENRSAIEALAKEDDEIRKFLRFCDDIKSLGADLHPEYETIADYIVYRDYLKNSSVPVYFESLRKHINSCHECSDIFNELKGEYTGVEFREKTETVQEPSAATQKHRKYSLFALNPIIRYAAAASVVFIIGLLGLSLYSSVSMPGYKKIAGNNPVEDISQFRGRSNGYFDKALSEIAQNKYDEAISLLNEDAVVNSGDKTIFYTHYVLGLLYLSKSEKSVLGVMKKYEREDLLNSIKQFQLVIDKNTSGRFENVTFDAYYYVGKAYLLLDDKAGAEKHLKLVIENRGSFMDDALTLLDLLNREN